MAYCLCLCELRDRGATQTVFTPEKASSLGIHSTGNPNGEK